MNFEECSRLPQIENDYGMPNKLYTGAVNIYAERKRAWIEALRWAASIGNNIEVAEYGSGFMRADSGFGTIANYERKILEEANRIEQL